SSDVCSSDLAAGGGGRTQGRAAEQTELIDDGGGRQTPVPAPSPPGRRGSAVPPIAVYPSLQIANLIIIPVRVDCSRAGAALLCFGHHPSPTTGQLKR